MYFALKPGARCGWAAWSPGNRLASGSFDISAAPEELGRAGCYLHANLAQLHAAFAFERLIYEVPKLPAEVTGEKHFTEIGRDIGLAAHIESFCHHMGIGCHRVALGTWQSTFLGKGHGERAKTFEGWMRARCEELGWWRLESRKEERAARGILDHLILLDERAPTPPWRERDWSDLQQGQAA